MRQGKIDPARQELLRVLILDVVSVVLLYGRADANVLPWFGLTAYLVPEVTVLSLILIISRDHPVSPLTSQGFY